MVTNRGRFSVTRCFLRTAAIIILDLALFLIPAHADDFTARKIGDYGNVTVMEVSGNFDAYSPDGTLNVLPRQIIAKEFLRTHKDEYDFVAIFTNFDYQRPPNAVAYYSSVKNDVQGIGQEIFDNSSLYGSNGKLQGTIDMWNLLKLATDPLDPKFNFTVDTLVHETLHRWGAYVHFKDWNGVESKAILGYQDDHWSFLFDSGGSTHLGNKWRDNGDGTFTSTAVRKYFSPLDLYLMGMIDKSKVPPTLLIENPAIDPERLSELGATIGGTARYVTVNDIIAVEGERIPSAKDSQKQFKTAFIYAVTPGTMNVEDLPALENLRSAYLTRFSILTDGQGLIQVAATPKDDLPVNPGVRPPTTVPRILPPNIDDGVKWLATHQMSDGSWTDFALTTERDTAEAVTTLQGFPVAQQQFLAGLQWLGSSAPANSDFLARRLEATIKAGGDGSSLASEILSRRNPDGGWGSGRNFISNPTDTALALKSLLRAGYGDQQVIGSAVVYLTANQKADGGWSGDDTVSTIQPTATVLAAFNSCRKSYLLENNITRAITFLSGKQNPDGGFGNSPSTVYDSAVAMMALQAAGADKEIVSRGAAYLAGLQTEDGSWQESPYQTALAVRALWQTTVDPDLAVKSADIVFIPEKVTSLPTTAVVNAVITNQGRSDVTQAKVAIYDGAISPEKKVGEQTVAFPGMSPVTVTFSVPVIDGNGHLYYVAVDPDNLVKEANENNNSAAKALLPEATYDFEVLASDLAVSKNPVDIYQEVRISVKVANKGTLTAYNVPVMIFIDEPGSPFEIATLNVDIPAGGSISKEITWKANKAGANMPLTVRVNPANTFSESSKTNNSAALHITVNNLTLAEPNLTVSYKDIVLTPNPADQGGKATLATVVKNTGNVDASNVSVSFYNGVPGTGGELIGSRTITLLAPSASQSVSVEWGPLNESGAKVVYVRVDPENAVRELSEEDNDAYGTLYVRRFPDIAVSASSMLISPAAPREGDVVSLAVGIANRGEQDAARVTVQLKEGSVVVGAVVIPLIAGNATATANFSYDTAGREGIHQLTAVVDPDNQLVEQRKDNNTATKTFAVQNLKLSVSEPFFSPNGDGVKDSTQISFRLDAPGTVTVQVLDAQGQTVRSFQDGELAGTTGAVVTWDGRSDKGVVVKDGIYLVQIRNLNGTMVGNVDVVVDNNASPFKEALLANELFKNNLTCKAAGITGMARTFWLDDESGYVWGNPDQMMFFPVNGQEPRLTNKNDPWFREVFRRPYNKSYLSYGAATTMWWDYSQYQVGFYGWLHEAKTYYYYYIGSSEYMWPVSDFVWSPDRSKVAAPFGGQFINYPYSSYSKLSVIEPFREDTPYGVSNNRHDLYGYGPLNSNITSTVSWSPDSTRLVYWDLAANQVKITDPSATTKVTLLSANDVGSLKWLDNDRILMTRGSGAIDYVSAYIVKASDGSTTLLTQGANPVLSNDRSKIFLQTSTRGAKIVGGDGGQLATFSLTNSSTLTPLWSPKGRCLALQQTTQQIEIYTLDTVTVLDTATGESHLLDNVHKGTVNWYDDDTLLYRKYNTGIVLYDLNTRTTKVLDSAGASSATPSPFSNYLIWAGGTSSACNGTPVYLVSSRQNLSAGVTAAKKGSSLVISGTATDRNFGGWQLEYADRSAPDSWTLVAPPSETPVVEGTFTSWVPPGEGIYDIRLTAWDKAGNAAFARTTVTWSNKTGLTSIYKNVDAISPNGDGINDTLDVHYSLPVPVHVDYFVYDAAGALVASGYAPPGAELLSWVGRDQEGRLVADGKYRISVLGTDLYFDVDSTRPLTSAVLSPITRDSSGGWHAELSGFMTDQNLKSWKVEYAEGDNSEEWLIFREGSGQIAKRDQYGNFVLPLTPDTLASFYGGDLGWLKGKKFRITTEDFAGNRSTSTTDFVEEKIFIGTWDRAVTPADDVVAPEVARPGFHLIGGAETLRAAAASTVLQYWNGRAWSDVATTEAANTGRMDFSWDTSSAEVGEGFAVRAKVQDVLGDVHYSNTLSTKALFTLEADCSLQLLGQNSLFEELKTLTIQTQANGGQWTDYRVYDAAKGDTIPVGALSEPGPSPAAAYVRMTAVGASGKTYQAGPVSYPPRCPVKFELGVRYEEAVQCGELSPGRVTLSSRLADSAGTVVFRNLSYYLQKSGGLELLGSFDVAKEGWKSQLLQTSAMTEGSYPVKAVLSYLDQDDQKVKEAQASATVTVDRNLPTARINAAIQNSCPVLYTSHSEWYGIPVDGAATDQVKVQSYQLLYGPGDNPVSWSAATGAAGVPLAGTGSKEGSIGVWNVASLSGGSYSLLLKVKDGVGNLGCATAAVSLDKSIAAPAVTVGPALFSPNNDGILDSVNLGMSLDDAAIYDARVFRQLAGGGQEPVAVRTLTFGAKHYPGFESLIWDGRSDGGAAVADGRYAVSVTVRDNCGNTKTRSAFTEVDSTAPAAAITYPASGSALASGNLVEVRGTASDAHFQGYQLEAGKGEAPTAWAVVYAGTKPVEGAILGAWNGYGLEGKWTLRLTVTDLAGNKNVAYSLVDLGGRSGLIKSVSVAPTIFSPNGDGKKDVATVAYEMATATVVDISIADLSGAVVRTVAPAALTAGSYSFAWDGKNNAGILAPDGQYKAKVHAVLAFDATVAQTEELTVALDTTPPGISVSAPAGDAYLNVSALEVTGDIYDGNLADYEVKVSGPAGTLLQKTGTQNRAAFSFGTLGDLSEETYTVSSQAKDAADNSRTFTQLFTIDRTPPKVTLDALANGSYFGFARSAVVLAGGVVEKNPASYSLKLGSGENPAAWTELAGGSSLTSLSSLPPLKVGKGDGIADGLYTIWFQAVDKAALEGGVKVRITVDNTPPETAITSLATGYVSASVDIAGTASDANFDRALLQLSEGDCASAYRWTTLKEFTAPLRNAVLYSWKNLPADGGYCLRLATTDKAGGSSEVLLPITVHVQPPPTPVLTAKLEGKTATVLNWTVTAPNGVAGYNVYRNGQRLTLAPVTASTYSDSNLKDGVYSYGVKAVDSAGAESPLSNAVAVTVDATGPRGVVTSPLPGARVTGTVDIYGTASSDDFKVGTVYIGQGSAPSSWIVVRTFTAPVPSGTLGRLDTRALADGPYTLKVEVEDLSGNVTLVSQTLTVDRSAPSAPVILTGTAKGSSVSVTWRANTETDLAGYLLMRNGQLVNGSGGSFSELKPFLVSGTSYSETLSDGMYEYVLVAVDTAGNISPLSNKQTVKVEVRAPHASIVEPVAGAKLEKATVRATSPDNDLAAVQFQFKKAQETAWSTLGSPVSGDQFLTSFDPKSYGLAYGDYNLRAVATDRDGKTDTAPGSITITYTDLTAPATPKALRQATSGQTATLSWDANGESDLGGYNIYRTAGATRMKLNTTPVNATSYSDANLSDGLYSYQLTAVDTFNNESALSGAVSAKIYAPVLTQPATPVKEPLINLFGNNADPGSAVEFLVESGQGQLTIGTVTADAYGSFSLKNHQLMVGTNRISARAVDAIGNISRLSNVVAVFYSIPPAAPAGFGLSVEGHNVSLSWTPSPESDVIGYNVYRDSQKLNAAVAVTTGTASASSTYYSSVGPANAFDRNTSTYWMSANYNTFSPAWWHLELPSPEMVSRVELQWLNSYYNFSAKDYEVQALVDNNWVSLAKVNGNTQFSVAHGFAPVKTSKVRIYITATNCPDYAYYKQVGIVEANIIKEQFITQSSYLDQNVVDGRFRYKVTAVNAVAFESPPSDEAVAEVGDVTAPAIPQGLAANPAGSSVLLSWPPNLETDLAGYNIYRNGAAGWTKLNTNPVAAATFSDLNLANGQYLYRLTAVDQIGNESAPGSEASALVADQPPPPPANLQLTVVPQGKKLQLAWDNSGGTTSGYYVYRGQSAGGPYQKLNASPLVSPSYLDDQLSNGTRYWYVVAAVDAVGNSSGYSNEGTGVPADTLAPASPVISAPVPGGQSVSVTEGRTTIMGYTAEGATVFLSRNDQVVASAATADSDLVEAPKAAANGFPYAASPDGRYLCFYNSGTQYMKIEDLAIGTITDVGMAANAPGAWSPDGKKLAYADNSNRIMIYEPASGTRYPLTSDAQAIEQTPSWSSDGRKVAFSTNRGGSSDRGGFSDIWIKDLSTGTLTQVTSYTNATYPVFSPDGGRIAYYSYSTFYVVDLATGARTLLDSYAVSNSLFWRKDGKQILFTSTFPRLGLYTVDGATYSGRRMIAYSNNQINGSWSPDLQSIGYLVRETDGTDSLMVANMNGEARAIQKQLVGKYYIQWTNRGLLFAIADGVRIASLKGAFAFPDMALAPGDNVFSAAAMDDSGNTSSQSDPITIFYDPVLVPDLSVSSEDISIYPVIALPGEVVSGTVTIRNQRENPVENVSVDIYSWDSDGALRSIKSETILKIAAESEETLSFDFDAGSKVGVQSIIAIVDPANGISELDETNNYATREMYVTDKIGISIVPSLSRGQYGSMDDAVVTVSVINNGPRTDGTLAVAIEDSGGVSVAVVDSSVIKADFGTTYYNYNWHTGAILAGSYKLHVEFRGTDGTITESSSPFTVLPDIRIESGVVTDKQGYSANDNVAVALNLKNNGSNYLVPQLKARVRITDAHDVTLFSDEKTVRNLFPATESSFPVQWNTGMNQPGDYRIVVETYLDDKLVSSSLARFVINPVSKLSGTVSVDPATVLIDNSIKAAFTVANSGNIGANGSVKGVIVSPESGAIIATAEQPVALATNGSQSGEFVFPTGRLELKSYLLSLQYSSQGIQKSIANTSFTVKDGTPPMVTIVSPLSGSSYNATVPIAILASDNASGVERVEYQVDGGAWRSLPLAEPASGRYAAAWEPTISDNGPHTVSFRATDRSGNINMAVSVAFDIQMDSIPPVTAISVGAPQYVINDNLYVSTATLFTLIASDDYSGVARTEYRIDDGQWLPSAPFAINVEGEHLLYYRSIDGAGNVEIEKTQKVTVDRTSPRTVLLASDPLIEGVENTVSPYTIFTMTASDGISGVKGIWYRIDSGPWQLFAEGFTLSGLPAGSHTIFFSAADNVGNEETEHAITVRLILMEMTKEISLDPVVLVGAWEDGANKIKNQRAIDALQQILSSRKVSFHIAETGDDFKRSLRSGRYNTYLLVDYRDEKVGAELREAVNRGDSLVFIKTRPSVDADMHEVFGVKLTGRTTSDNLPVHLTESPFGGEETLQSGGKPVVIGEILAETVQVFGQVDDKRNLYPALIFNEYGNGKVILYTFDLLGSPEKEKVGDLIGSSLVLLKPEQHTVRALGTLPVRIAVAGSGPIGLLMRETIPVGSAADSIVPHGTATDRTITWLKDLGVSSVANFAYYLDLPDVAGEYTVATEVMYANYGEYWLYESAQLTASVQKSSADLLRESIDELSNLPVASSNDLAILSDLLNRLSRITTDPAGLKDAEKGIDDVIAVSRLIRVLSADVVGIRVKLDELLKILERKWYLLELQENNG